MQKRNIGVESHVKICKNEFKENFEITLTNPKNIQVEINRLQYYVKNQA